MIPFTPYIWCVLYKYIFFNKLFYRIFSQFYQVPLNRFSFNGSHAKDSCQEESCQKRLTLQMLKEIIGNNH